MCGTSGVREAAYAGGLPTIDVIVATRNRPVDLVRLLDALAKQTVRDFRTFIVDQSDDPSVGSRAVRSLGDDRVVHLPQSGTGKSRALNYALGHTTATLLLFTDDDCVPPPDWVATARSAGNRSGIALCFGRVTAHEQHDHGSEFMPVSEFDERVVLRCGWLRSRPSFGMGANMCVRRVDLEACGGFDERFGPGSELRAAEDVELAYRIQRRGGLVSRDPRLWVVHHGGRPLGAVSSQHVADAYYGIGAVYGTWARGADVRAVVVTLDEVWQTGKLIAQAVARRQRPTHLRRLLALMKGLVDGFLSGKPLVAARRSTKPQRRSIDRLSETRSEPPR